MRLKLLYKFFVNPDAAVEPKGVERQWRTVAPDGPADGMQELLTAAIRSLYTPSGAQAVCGSIYSMGVYSMNITIACVGKIKEKYLREGIAEYEKRLSGYCRLDWYEVADEKTPEGASAAEEKRILDAEGARLLRGIPDQAYVIALAIGGESPDSVQLAGRLERLALSGHSRIVFVIGGSLGLSDAVLRRADWQLSFSKLTFPHQMMRMILLEQIYRSFRIQRHEPYHK